MALLDLLGRRWTLRVLWELRDGPVKFRELAQRADAMSQSVLSRRLNELETACFVTSDEDGWRLTDNGSELLQVFSPLSRFATRWAELRALRSRPVSPGRPISRRRCAAT